VKADGILVDTMLYRYEETILYVHIVVGYTRVSVWISRGIQYWQVLAITRVAGE